MHNFDEPFRCSFTSAAINIYNGTGRYSAPVPVKSTRVKLHATLYGLVAIHELDLSLKAGGQHQIVGVNRTISSFEDLLDRKVQRRRRVP